jgi:methyl acetate hydrolase
VQELLGRIARLDPSASLGLRVIACFDELMVGNVNTRALLSAAASLAGCVAGFRSDSPARTVRIDPRGHHALGDAPAPLPPGLHLDASDGLTVWLEREGERLPNDAIVLERLALAVRVRHGRGRHTDDRRDLSLLLDESVDLEARYVAASSLGLRTDARHRVVCAPLFAVWPDHPRGAEDVVATRFGTIHALVLPADHASVTAAPSGVGVATDVEHLHHSFRTAMVALRLCDPPTVTSVLADDFGGLVGLLADVPEDSHQPDVDLVDSLVAHPWGRETLDAVVRAQSLRQAARIAGVHHSTMQARLETVTTALGFDPFDGFGRARLGTAYLVWRLRHSRVLDLPAPTPG